MESNKIKCDAMDEMLADLLLDPAAAPENVTLHVAECPSCRTQLEELRATMALMDSWEVPEPNPYFMTRFQARMNEERAAGPASWPARMMARLRDRMLLGPQLHARPLAAMVLTGVLMLGGGAYLGITNWEQPQAPSKEAAVVHDLQTLDSNAQLLDQLESISSPPDSGDGDVNQN